MTKTTSRSAAIVLMLLAGIIAYRLIVGSHKPGPRIPKGAVPVTVAIAAQHNVSIYLDALGTVQAYRTVTVQPMITGPMISVEFHQGQNVRRGQLLAEIDPRPYRAALDQAVAKRAQDRATLAEARENLKRYEMLVTQHYTSAQQVADQAATVAEDAALVKQDEAAIETARTNLSYTKITAPISGRTGILQVNAGNIVSPGLSGGIVVITTLQPIFVVFSLPQQDLPAVQQALRIGPPEVLATNGNAVMDGPVIDRGVLSVLDNQVNASTGTLTLKARFPNPKLALWPGAFINIRLKVRTDRNAIIVPSVAVRQGPMGPFVYVVTGSALTTQSARGTASTHPPIGEGSKVVARRITLGYSNQSITEITSGLIVADRVVTEGGSRLRDGALVQIRSVPHGISPNSKTTPATHRQPLR